MSACSMIAQRIELSAPATRILCQSRACPAASSARKVTRLFSSPATTSCPVVSME